MKPWFWTKIPDKKIDNTLWEALDDAGVDVAASGIVAMFKRAEEKPTAARAEAAGAAAGKKDSKPKTVSVLDGKRQQNCGIAVARVKLSPSELRAALLAMDPDRLSGELCNVLTTVQPNAEEVAMLLDAAANNEPGTKMHKLDVFMLGLAQVPHLSGRLGCLAAMRNFGNAIPKLGEGMGVIQAALREVSCAPAVLELLRHALKIGNYLNAGTSRGASYGFKLDALGKMAAIKSNTPKMTLLHFFVLHLASLSAPQPSMFEYLPAADVEGGEGGDAHKAVLKQRKVAPLQVTHSHATASTVAAAAEGDGPTLLAAALRALRVCRSVSDTSLGNLRGETEGLKSTLRSTQKEVDSVQAALADSKKDHPAEDKLPQVVAPFVRDAQEAVDTLDSQLAHLERRFAAVVKGFGEDARKTDADTFFCMLGDFSRKLQRCAEETARLLKTEEKGGGAAPGSASSSSGSSKAPTKKMEGGAGGAMAAMAAQAAMMAAKRGK